MGRYSKLEWAKAGESERQLRDVSRIVQVSGETLDMSYLNEWILELRLAEMWRRSQRLVETDRG